jgi:hypothetical protein
MESLTSRVLQYQRSRTGIEDLVAEIAPRVLRFPRTRFGWDEDACSDFYLFFHPRLLRVLDRFRDQGKPFEAYLASALRWQARSFARRRKRTEQTWAMGPRLAADAAADLEPQSCAPDRCSQPRPLSRLSGVRPGAAEPRESERRSLLYLVLKCSRRLDADELAAAAELTRIDPRRLAALIERLRCGQEQVERRLAMLRQRRNRAFSEARILETRIAGSTDPAAAAELQRRLSAANRRMRAAMERMARVRRDPTNREVARALGIPKGTVDCALFLLKRKLASGYDPDRERSA